MEEEEGKLGNYRLGETLGKGTFGKVYLGTHLITKELVAVKVLDKSKIEDEDDRTRIIREIEILRMVRHPNICQLYEVLEDRHKIYLVTEYCEEGELLSYISRRKRLKESRASKLINQILNALLYLKHLGVVHRDLKPENILLDFDFNVKLIDFGLSNYSRGELLETACGSPCYASPEMISGLAYDGYKSDAWSLGVILYVMVCGELPFEEKSTKELYAKIIAGEHKRIPDYLRKETVALLRALLNVRPDSRMLLEHIRSQPFCQWTADSEPEIKGIVVGKHAMPIDLELLQDMQNSISFTIPEGEESIRCNRHNSITTTYYLLQKKVLREGGKTVLDLQYYL
jgi:5'-AMP-activated protein kinase catalytic alpha subunit